MAVMLVARFAGDVEELKAAYDRAHRQIMEAGPPSAELRHHCAIGDGALYVIGVWQSEQLLRARWGSHEFEETLTTVGFPSPRSAEVLVLQLHATEPPL
jgi:hypothetical protein